MRTSCSRVFSTLTLKTVDLSVRSEFVAPTSVVPVDYESLSICLRSGPCPLIGFSSEKTIVLVTRWNIFSRFQTKTCWCDASMLSTSTSYYKKSLISRKPSYSDMSATAALQPQSFVPVKRPVHKLIAIRRIGPFQLHRAAEDEYVL